MKFQLFGFLAIAAFTSSVFALPSPDCTCANSCTVQCAAQAGRPCLCPDVCDPVYSSCTTRRSILEGRDAEAIPIETIPCGCYNDCTLYGCGDDVPADECYCTKECDLKYACPEEATTTVAALAARQTVTCGPCTNACKIACPTCICPQYCGMYP